MLVRALITKTRLYNFDPVKPHFYIVKLEFTGIYIIILISAQKHRLWVLTSTHNYEAVLTSTHNLCFEQKYEKYQSFSSENFQFLEMKFSIYLNRRVFVMFIAAYKVNLRLNTPGIKGAKIYDNFNSTGLHFFNAIW